MYVVTVNGLPVMDMSEQSISYRIPLIEYSKLLASEKSIEISPILSIVGNGHFADRYHVGDHEKMVVPLLHHHLFFQPMQKEIIPRDIVCRPLISQEVLPDPPLVSHQGKLVPAVIRGAETIVVPTNVADDDSVPDGERMTA
jgi:hypothetical protein